MYKRIDTYLSKAVERGLLVDRLRGSYNAWVYMEKRSVPQEVIIRVLCLAARRRVSDIKMLSAWIEPCRSDSANSATMVLEETVKKPKKPY